MTKRDNSDCINMGAQWLLNSEIRNSRENDINQGSLNDGYRFRGQCGYYSYVFNEITGYSISSYLNLFEWFGEEKYLIAAKAAGDYLVKIQNIEDDKCKGAFYHSYIFSNKKYNYDYYSFDVAICASGLIDLYNATNDEKYLNSAVLAGDWLIEKMQKDDGSFLALYDKETNNFEKLDFKYRWFYDGGCLHAKNAIALTKLAKMGADKKYETAAKNVCDWVLMLQDSDGSFWSNIRKDYVFTHSHCYALEGLLYTGWCLDVEKYRQAVINGAEWLIKNKFRDGAFIDKYKIGLIKRIKQSMKHEGIKALFYHKRTDATSQSIRLWMVLYYLTQNNIYLKHAKTSKKFIYQMQCFSSEESNKSGGFYYELFDCKLLTFKSRLISSWTTMFSISALQLFEINQDNIGFIDVIRYIY